MKARINRTVLIMPDGRRIIFRPCIVVPDLEEYRRTIRQSNGALRVLFDWEEVR